MTRTERSKKAARSILKLLYLMMTLVGAPVFKDDRGNWRDRRDRIRDSELSTAFGGTASSDSRGTEHTGSR